IQQLKLLKDLFPQAGFFITPAVQNDLMRAKESGYNFIDYLWNTNMFNKEEVGRLINEIERKDRVRIKDKSQILF
ncbi:MAG: hypothetical protein AB1595_05110, partial [bacterium]